MKLICMSQLQSYSLHGSNYLFLFFVIYKVLFDLIISWWRNISIVGYARIFFQYRGRCTGNIFWLLWTGFRRNRSQRLSLVCSPKIL